MMTQRGDEGEGMGGAHVVAQGGDEGEGVGQGSPLLRATSGGTHMIAQGGDEGEGVGEGAPQLSQHRCCLEKILPLCADVAQQVALHDVLVPIRLKDEKVPTCIV